MPNPAETTARQAAHGLQMRDYEDAARVLELEAARTQSKAVDDWRLGRGDHNMRVQRSSHAAARADALRRIADLVRSLGYG